MDAEALSTISEERGFGNGVHPAVEMVLTYRMDRASWREAVGAREGEASGEGGEGGGEEGRDELAWARALFTTRHRSAVFTQLPGGDAEQGERDGGEGGGTLPKVPKDLQEGLGNFGLFVFPADIKIGVPERRMQSLLSRAEKEDKPEEGGESAVAALRKEILTPKQHSFAVTIGNGTRVYGHVFSIMVPFDAEELARLRRVSGDDTSLVPGELFEPLAFCVLTRLPFHRTFETAIGDFFSERYGAVEIASARDIARDLFVAFNTETPVPPSLAPPDPQLFPEVASLLQKLHPAYPHIDGRSYLDASMTYPLYKGQRHQHHQRQQKQGPMLPMLDVDLSILFQSLCPRNILRVLRAVMMDQCIIFFSDDNNQLLPAIEGLAGMCYPFDIHCNVYMPVVPMRIARSNDGVLFSMPFQYVMGMPKQTLAYVDAFIPSSVTRVDLVSNTVWQGNEETYPHLPTVLMLKLYKAYHRYGGFGLGTLSLIPAVEATTAAEEPNATVSSDVKGENVLSDDASAASVQVVVGEGEEDMAADQSSPLDLSIPPPDLPEGVDPIVKVLALQMYGLVAGERSISPNAILRGRKVSSSTIRVESASGTIQGGVSGGAIRGNSLSKRAKRNIDSMVQGLFTTGKKGMVRAATETRDMYDMLDPSRRSNRVAQGEASAQDMSREKYSSGVGLGMATGPGTRAFKELHKTCSNRKGGRQITTGQSGGSEPGMSAGGGSSAAVTGIAVSFTSGAAGGDNFQELREDAFSWEDIPRKMTSMKHGQSASGSAASADGIGDALSTCQTDLLRIKTMSFMLSLFKSYAIFMSNPAGNVLLAAEGGAAATAADIDLSTLSAAERIQMIRRKKKSFDLAGFLADCLAEDAPFLERFVGFADAEGGNDSSAALDARSNRENGTQVWSLFVQERELQERNNLDAFAVCSLWLMQERAQSLQASITFGWEGYLWVLPRRRQNQMNRFARAAEKNRKNMLKEKRFRSVAYANNTAKSSTSERAAKQKKEETTSRKKSLSLFTGPTELLNCVLTRGLSLGSQQNSIAELAESGGDEQEVDDNFQGLTEKEKSRNKEFQDKAWLLTKVCMSKTGLTAIGSSFKVEIEKAEGGSPGTLIRVPSSDANAGRLFKTPFAFEIVQPNGVVHTLCSTSAVERREVLEAIDARRRGGSSLTDLQSTYLGRGTMSAAAGGGKKGKMSSAGGSTMRLMSRELRQQKQQETAEWAGQHLSEPVNFCSCKKGKSPAPEKTSQAQTRRSSFFARVFGKKKN